MKFLAPWFPHIRRAPRIYLTGYRAGVSRVRVGALPDVGEECASCPPCTVERFDRSCSVLRRLRECLQRGKKTAFVRQNNARVVFTSFIQRHTATGQFAQSRITNKRALSRDVVGSSKPPSRSGRALLSFLLVNNHKMGPREY